MRVYKYNLKDEIMKAVDIYTEGYGVRPDRLELTTEEYGILASNMFAYPTWIKFKAGDIIEYYGMEVIIIAK